MTGPASWCYPSSAVRRDHDRRADRQPVRHQGHGGRHPPRDSHGTPRTRAPVDPRCWTRCGPTPPLPGPTRSSATSPIRSRPATTARRHTREGGYPGVWRGVRQPIRHQGHCGRHPPRDSHGTPRTRAPVDPSPGRGADEHRRRPGSTRSSATSPIHSRPATTARRHTREGGYPGAWRADRQPIRHQWHGGRHPPRDSHGTPRTRAPVDPPPGRGADEHRRRMGRLVPQRPRRFVAARLPQPAVIPAKAGIQGPGGMFVPSPLTSYRSPPSYPRRRVSRGLEGCSSHHL